jgi:hypothetical protein
MSRQADSSRREWQLLEPLSPAPKLGGRPVKYPRREVVNVIRYILRTAFHYSRTWAPRWSLTSSLGADIIDSQYEELSETTEARLYTAMTGLLLRCLALRPAF